MGSNRTFAYNSGSAIPGTEQVGYIAVGLDGSKNYGGSTWWPGPDENPGYIICHTSGERTAAQGTIPVAAPTIGFWRSALKTEDSFVFLCNARFPGNSFTTGDAAATWLGSNGYWNSYPAITNLDALAYYDQFISVGGVMGYHQALALNKLFDDLQNNYTQAGPSFYDVLEGFYPMLGTSAATQAINGNGNSAYNLTLYGGWAFDSMGMKGNGINTYAETNKYYGAISDEELWNTHFSIYGTAVGSAPSNSADLSTFNNVNPPSVTIALNSEHASGNAIYEYEYNTYSAGTLGNSGDFVTISNDGSTTRWSKNGSAGSPVTSDPYLLGTEGLVFGLSTPNGYGYPTVSTNRYGWASFGGFMNNDDMGTYQTIVNTFMTSIGRNTY